MHCKELELHINTFLNTANIKDFCPNGLQVEGKKEIKTVATAVSADLMTLQKAAEKGVDALIVHHGIFWNQDSYPIVGAKYQKLELLIKNGISLFGYHLPLDAHRAVGNNWHAAHSMGWENLEPFGEFNGVLIGVKGFFSPMPIKSFIQKLEAFYEHSAAVALGGKEIVASAALVSGGAYRELAKAALLPVDCFITGNFDEPAWGVAYEERINFIALGHSATERIGPKALADYLKKELDLEAFFLDSANPF